MDPSLVSVKLKVNTVLHIALKESNPEDEAQKCLIRRPCEN
jgi:hypothetical protein